MKYSLSIALTLAALSALCLARSDHKSDRWSVREQETIQNTLTLSGDPMRLVVDNVNGYVHATGTNGSEVRVTAHKVIRAETDSDLQEAKNEVKLEVTGKPGTVSIYYDAPWRCNNGEGNGCHGDHRRFYEVVYDIDVEVPRGARTVISTINDGDIRVAGIDGVFDVHNVNGAISMTGVSGSGDVRTVNGPVSVHFAKNPAGPGSFKTINGEVDVYFQPNLSADLLFKTFNGEIYSDFDVAARPAPASVAEDHNGKFVFRSSGARAGRAGQGGPELSFDSFNGNIRLHREK
jgi:hypothetical protein